MNKLLVGLIFLFGFTTTSFGQKGKVKEQQVKVLNEYLKFTNESIHGMLVVHRLLENYNQDINKYVDLESFKINFYGNRDLPKNIFVDEENWFYDDSPYELYASSKQMAAASPLKNQAKVQQLADQMKAAITNINQIRFDLENLINTLDLEQRENLSQVYERLEEGVELYDAFFNYQEEMQILLADAFQPLIPTAEEIQYPQLHREMAELYLAARSALRDVKMKEADYLDEKIAKLGKELNDFRNLELENFGSIRVNSKKGNTYKSNIVEQAELLLAELKKFYSSGDVPQEYKQYGKFYYYYNSNLINKFNRYGNGMVFEMNNFTEYLQMPVMLFTELPHYFKVIYPKKLQETEFLAASDNKIEKLPDELKDRKIQMSTRQIKVDSSNFEVLLYDHMIEDGDIVSLNFNGDWVVEKHKLTAKPISLKLSLNKTGKNFFILHAENVGRRPPNTMAVDYSYRGRKQQIILKSDLAVSEMIEIILVE